ncbi:uncharacterized protein MKK02DRAFT_29757 [Dioszegia hungarica]|uniref:Translocon-associated protein subunit alpha n=1 Tax=Dioszegia hungarica TaxID=4972 RepID=A0AA38HI26_9TREE|nr:uncharacterized protein MKK02DRAFT_29757 [Dioszegia hungarica]KAI9639774.1 hypothetical protein MKK02DRAFT_29757 [Dioszegia hungarica]
MGIFSHHAADDVTVTATFPESNTFGQLVNGQRNDLFIHLANNGKKNYTLVSAGASYHDPLRNWALVKNQTITRFGVPLVSGSNYSAPFNVYSEHRPSEVGLTVWVNLADGTTKEILPITAFNQTVSVVEPPLSWIDPSLLLVYSLLLAALGAGAWLAYNSFMGNQAGKKGSKRTVKRAVVVAKQENQVYPDVKPYEEEWIPAHHLKSGGSKLKKRGGKGVPGASSGAEELTSGGEVTSGAETSGAEGRKVKGKKGKKA